MFTLVAAVVLMARPPAPAAPPVEAWWRQDALFKQIAARLDAVRAIDNHTHLLSPGNFNPDLDALMPLGQRSTSPATARALAGERGAAVRVADEVSDGGPMIRPRLRLAPCWLWLVPALAAAQGPPSPPPAPCSGPEWKQLDFWVGEWDLTWPARGPNPAGTASNRIEKVLGGCVVEESFAANGPAALVGRSFSAYDARAKRWRQTWVDNEGSYLDFEGGLDGGNMALIHHSTTREGQPQMGRMVFLNVTADSLDWRWEKSLDGGKTWQLQWPIHYVRKGRAP